MSKYLYPAEKRDKIRDALISKWGSRISKFNDDWLVQRFWTDIDKALVDYGKEVRLFTRKNL